MRRKFFGYINPSPMNEIISILLSLWKDLFKVIMKSLVVSLISLAFVLGSNGYSFSIPAGQTHPGVCYYNGLMLKQGDNSIPSTCQNVRCNEDGSMLVQGCGHFDMTDCRVIDSTNLHKPYPECCRMNFICTDKNGEAVRKEASPLEGKVYA